MRICLYTETALPKVGGQELVVDALARQFLALGHEPVVLTQPPRRPLRPDDRQLPYPVVRHPRFISTRRLVSWYRYWLIKLHRQYHFDVVHCQSVYPCGYLAALSRSKLNVPVVVTSHGGDVRENNARIVKRGMHKRHALAIESADALVAISRFTSDGYRRIAPAAKNIITIPNGVDYESFQAEVTRPKGLDASIREGRYFLFLGRLHRRKGVDVLLKALARVSTDASMQLVVAGDGDQREILVEQAERLGISDRVRFIGPVHGALKTYLLQNALCLVLPSQSEAFPLVVLEAYASGCPVIGSKIPGLEGLVQPDQTGHLVPAESPGKLAAALEHVWRNPGGARAMGERAHRLAQGYGWPSIAARHIELYEDLLDPGNARKAA